MALYDNKYWLLSHIRNSFISTDDTGMCELVMVDNLPAQLVETLNVYPDTDESLEDEDEMEHESYDIQLDMELSTRHRSNTAARLEKMDLARKRAARMKNIKWETPAMKPSEQERTKFFVEKIVPRTAAPRKSLLSEQIQKCTNLPQNPFIEYAKFDGSAQVGIPVRKYKIFLTMLPEEHRNYPMNVVCVATAKIQELIGLICLKCSTIHGDFTLQPVHNHGLYITEEDGEVDRDFPCLDPKECVAKFGFHCLGLVEHKHSKNVTFENVEDEVQEPASTSTLRESRKIHADETKQLTADMQAMNVHTKTMEAPLYQSYRVYILNKLRTKAEILLGISGDKIEIDPVQQKSLKFVLARQKAVSHHMDCVASCVITDTRGSKSTFRVVYSLAFGPNSRDSLGSPLQTSASFKHYDFEGESGMVEEIVQKINLILEIRTSASRKEYLSAQKEGARHSDILLPKTSYYSHS